MFKNENGAIGILLPIVAIIIVSIGVYISASNVKVKNMPSYDSDYYNSTNSTYRYNY